MIVPILDKNNSDTIKWMESNGYYNDDSWSWGVYEWHRAIEKEIRNQVYNQGFLRKIKYGIVSHIGNDLATSEKSTSSKSSNKTTSSYKKGTPFVNINEVKDYSPSSNNTSTSSKEWKGHNITHPYNRFISLYIHYNANENNYSENVQLNETEVFKNAVQEWRENQCED